MFKVTALLAVLFLLGCASIQGGSQTLVSAESLFKPRCPGRNAAAVIIFGAKAGNSILVTEASLYSNFKIYRKAGDKFKLLTNLQLDPHRSSEKVKVWIDPGYRKQAKYTVIGVDRQGKGCDYPVIMTPTGKGKKR